MDRYPNISDHGLIGDLQTAALVTTNGTINFFCCPRFDSPSVFASLLDADKGGYFSVRPDTADYVTRQLYFPDTAMLITRFLTQEGAGEVTDFMPIAGSKPTDRHRLVRQLKVVRGTMKFVAEVKPRFDCGRAKHKLDITHDGFDGRPPAPHPAGRAAAASRRHEPVLAELAAPVNLPGPVAGDREPIGDDAQTHDLCAVRRPGRRAHDRAS